MFLSSRMNWRVFIFGTRVQVVATYDRRSKIMTIEVDGKIVTQTDGKHVDQLDIFPYVFMHLQEKFGVRWSVDDQQFILEVNGKLISTYQFLDPNHSKSNYYLHYFPKRYSCYSVLTDLYNPHKGKGDDSVKTI